MFNIGLLLRANQQATSLGILQVLPVTGAGETNTVGKTSHIVVSCPRLIDEAVASIRQLKLGQQHAVKLKDLLLIFSLSLRIISQIND